MPVTYTIDPDRALVRTRCTGEVTLTEVLGHFAELARDPHRPDRLDVLLDLSELSSLPEPGQLRLVAHEIGTIEGEVRFRACAIVATQDVVFGLARMFEAFASTRFETTRVCRTLEEAEGWLRGQAAIDS
jgi:hypothetical protein